MMYWGQVNINVITLRYSLLINREVYSQPTDMLVAEGSVGTTEWEKNT
jgi:hypothetical protein